MCGTSRRLVEYGETLLRLPAGRVKQPLCKQKTSTLHPRFHVEAKYTLSRLQFILSDLVPE